MDSVQPTENDGNQKLAHVEDFVRLLGEHQRRLFVYLMSLMHDRKSYLGSDLTAVDVQQVEEASLQLTAAPTEMGFALRMPDATFAIYGVTDEARDDWQPNELNWENAPASNEGAAAVDGTKATLLGRFEVPQGQQRGEFSISGQRRVDFLQSDTNGFVTLVVVPETREAHAGSLVHGFAASRHETLPPPTLRLWMAESE